MNYDTGFVCALTSFFWFVLMPYQPAAQYLRARVRVREMLHLSQALPNVSTGLSLSLSLSLSPVCVCVCVYLYTRTRKYAHTIHTRTQLVSQCPVHTQALCPQNRYLFVISCVGFTIHTSMHGHAMQSFISEH